MTSAPPVRHRRLLWLVAAIAAAGAGVFSLSSDWLTSAENHATDLLFQARGAVGGEPQAVIVGVAESSLAQAERFGSTERPGVVALMKRDWPWDRRVFAETVRKLRAHGARAIVFDIVFGAETEGDGEFARAIAEPGAPVVLASFMEIERSPLGEARVKPLEPQSVLRRAAAERVGYATVFPDSDGALRVGTTLLQDREFLGYPPVPGESERFSLAAAGLQAAGGTVARLPAGSAINFCGPPGTIPALPIEDLFLPDRWKNSLPQAGALFRDKIVWVGATAENRFNDVYITPFGRMSGVEAQAQTLEMLRGRGPLKKFSPAQSLACVWALAATGVWLAWSALRVSRQLAVIALVALAWAALAFGLFSSGGIVLPFVAPLAAWLIAGGVGVGVRFIAEQRERHRLRDMLGRYVSEEVARIITEQPEEFSQALRGGRRPVTILFADLRGFTTWVETAEPEAFVAQLNEYFGAVVDCVLAEGGTLQKFIGDAVLAVWGDTRSAGPTEDTARAVNAALAMEAAVARLNARWAGRPDRTPMQIGIGLHHGVAMVGNVGHTQRMEFTVLGDVVNVAARLESANRQLGTTILVSETIRDLLIASHRCASLGRFGLKGRREAVGLFAPLVRSTEAAPGWIAANEAALAAWNAGEFSTAAESYATLALQPTPLAEFFREQSARARHCAAHPPADWRGEFRFDSK
jgi:adenylate cyclase